jgi:hypothetical protein
MRRWLWFVAAVLWFASPAARSDSMDLQVTLVIDTYNGALNSRAYVDYCCTQGVYLVPGVGFEAYHAIVQSSATYSGRGTTPWSHLLSASGSAGSCYTGRITATADNGVWGTAGSTQICYDGPPPPPPSPPPPPPPPPDTADQNASCDWVSCYSPIDQSRSGRVQIQWPG